MAASVETVIVSVTGVDPLPAAIVAGLNVYTLPAGSPLTLKLMAAGNVAPLGESVSANVAIPPG